jgi:hypothetical protein
MSVSTARFVSLNQNGFVPATIANCVAGTVTNYKYAAGQYGAALGNSATVTFAFHLAGAGVTPSELLPPYEQYNIPDNFPTNLNEIAIYYDVAGDALTSATVGIYATGSNSQGTQTVTLLPQGQNGLTLDIAYSVWSIALKNLPDAPPNPVINVEFDLATSGSGTAIVFGCFYR